MKMMLLAWMAAGMMLAGVSCERHSWDETRKLHEKHGGHSDHADKAGHGQGNDTKAAGHEEGGGEKH